MVFFLFKDFVLDLHYFLFPYFVLSRDDFENTHPIV